MYLPKSRTSFYESELQSYLELKIKMQSISNILSFHLNAPQMTVEIWSLKINEDVCKGLLTPHPKQNVEITTLLLHVFILWSYNFFYFIF